ncbi:MAG: glycosyltransferase family 39 protein [Anaerolineaceae bacterium]|nr:glycosyltransferase family 39 protein [Anaerolineaceae bacterium]
MRSQPIDSRFALHWTRRDTLVLLFVILLAFTYRMVILAERAAAPPEISAVDPLPVGDQTGYYNNAAYGFDKGTYPPKTFFFQPGMSYFLRALMLLTGSKDLIVLRVVCIALASLNCGLMVFVGWFTTKRREVGYLSGLILALYPVASFYDTDFVIASQAIILTTLQVFAALWLWRKPRLWWGSILLGLAAGAGWLTRVEVLIIAPVMSLILIAIRRDLRVVLQISLAAILGLMVVAPAIQHNLRGGADGYYVTPVIWENLYRTNSRDAQGTYWLSNAFRSTNRGDYPRYLKLDIQLDPTRFVELMLYKTSLYFSNHEPGSNLDYYKMGEGASLALRINPIAKPILIAVFLFGLAQLLRRRQFAAFAFFSLTSLAFFLVVLVEYMVTRIYLPAVVMFIPPAAFGIISLYDALHEGRLRQLLLRSVPIFLLIGVFSYAVAWGASNLPNDPTVPELPAGAVAKHMIYDDVLELVGWQLRDQYSPRNVLSPTKPWVVTLYWRLLKDTEVDYSFSLKYLIGDDELTAVDFPIGHVVYPWVHTGELNPGKIYVEHVGLRVNHFNGPFEETGRIVLRVYPEKEWQNLLPAKDENGTDQGEIVLSRPAIRRGHGLSAIEADETHIRFSDELILRGWRIPENAAAGETIEVLTAWRTGEQ